MPPPGSSIASSSAPSCRTTIRYLSAGHPSKPAGETPAKSQKLQSTLLGAPYPHTPPKYRTSHPTLLADTLAEYRLRP
eukprot:1940311-Rhodomonas_salina.2